MRTIACLLIFAHLSFMMPAAAYAAPPKGAIKHARIIDALEDANEGEIPKDGKISWLEADQKAPFEGYLLDSLALGQLLAEIDLAAEKCEIRCERDIELLRAELQLRIDQTIAERDMWKTRHDDLRILGAEREAYYEKLLKKKTRPNLEGPAFAGGLALGVLGIVLGSIGIVSATSSLASP